MMFFRRRRIDFAHSNNPFQAEASHASCAKTATARDFTYNKVRGKLTCGVRDVVFIMTD